MTAIMILGMILLVLFVLALSFGFTAGIIWLICWAFGFAFSLKLAFGIWLVISLLSGIFRTHVTVNK